MADSLEKKKRKFITTVLRQRFYPSLFQAFQKLPTEMFALIPSEEILIELDKRWNQEWEQICIYIKESNEDLFSVSQEQKEDE
jgi:hypothetical protein